MQYCITCKSRDELVGVSDERLLISCEPSSTRGSINNLRQVTCRYIPAMLRESRKGRWRSVLQKKTLEELSPYCPGAKTLVGFRKTCTGYFMAE